MSHAGREGRLTDEEWAERGHKEHHKESRQTATSREMEVQRRRRGTQKADEVRERRVSKRERSECEGESESECGS